jgi:Fuc2NAc and GlcNAc transferase
MYTIFLFSFLVSGLGAWLAMKFGDRIGISDIPNHRSSHSKIIPKGGGIGILTVFIIVSLFLSIPVSLWLPSLVIALVSLWGGDLHDLPVKKRLLIQFCCSMVFLFFFLSSKQVSTNIYLLCVLMSIFIVGTSNFYNFMDGIDGISGISGVVGFSLLSYYSSMTGTGDVYGLLSLALACSCLGFLCFNLPKAKVFLGDVGSILLGFLFASIVVILSKNMTDFLVLTGFLAPYYFDEIFTMIVRIKDGDSLVIAHRKHIYQLLANELGISHWKVSLAYGLSQLLIGLSLIFVKPKGIFFILLAYLVYCLIFIWVSIKIRRKVSIK